ncbi:acyl-CoA dehydrogenase family protein [Mycolicibacter sinensis]|uniref:Acyl-CoA dehydrogenase n=1 Tax=Mycolicibacter sinensis (strain JDM601) TaxID=875328 RepID=A0A1A3TM39_MYCSD|nr:acyl-CoA dehydrogenase family protein [Mycolicibacter sinensis]OBK83382.1 acyl-CoA dehydrogenase [Mycolicibacter sinensis]
MTVEAVRALLPAIAEAAADVDRNGAVDPDIIRGLHDAGFFAMLRPTAFGGLQADPEVYLTASGDIAAACTSTGWLAAMLGVHAWHLALFDEQAQRDVWGADPRALLCESYAPTGRLEHVNGGFRLSGRWSRCAGAHHASWLMAGAVLVGEDGAAQDFTVALVPREDFTIESNWDGVGLRGIGADEVVVSGAMVPHYRTLGVSQQPRATLAPLYRLPQTVLYTHAGTVPVVGAALGLLAARTPELAGPLDAIATASAGVQLSIHQMRRNLAEFMSCAASDAFPDAELLLRGRRDQVVAFERSVQLIRWFVERSGADLDGLVDRVWRDVQTARMHVSNDAERVLSVVGQFEFGLKVDEFIL